MSVCVIEKENSIIQLEIQHSNHLHKCIAIDGVVCTHNWSMRDECITKYAIKKNQEKYIYMHTRTFLHTHILKE